MVPIHELLNRIKWDENFGQADFVIGYRDRFQNDLVRVPLNDVRFDLGDHFDFELVDDTGETHSIPLHRIRQVYRNGRLIWCRDDPE